MTALGPLMVLQYGYWPAGLLTDDVAIPARAVSLAKNRFGPDEYPREQVRATYGEM